MITMKLPIKWINGCVLAVVFAFVQSAAWAKTDVDANTNMQLEAMNDYLGAALKSATGNQSYINDPQVGDKGITSTKVLQDADKVFEAKHKKAFLGGSGDKLFDEARQALVTSVTEVVDSYQSVINEEGKGFKGFIPAVFRSKVSLAFNEKMVNKMAFQATAPKKFLRNRKHRPDDWETLIMSTKFQSADGVKDQPYGESTKVNGKSAYRYMKPLYFNEGCLACHGDPKGERDISGYLKEGGKVGEFSGAMSFIVYK